MEGQARGAHREAVPARGDLRWWAIASGVVTVNAVLWRLLAHPGTIHGQEALKVGYALEYLLPFTAGLVTPTHQPPLALLPPVALSLALDVPIRLAWAWAFNLPMVALLLWATLRIGTLIGGRPAGRMAMLVLACHPLILRYTHLFNMELALAATVALHLHCLARLDSRPHRIAAGLLFGVGALVKLTLPIYLLGPALVMLIHRSAAEGKRPKTGGGWRDRRVLELLGWGIVGLALPLLWAAKFGALDAFGAAVKAVVSVERPSPSGLVSLGLGLQRYVAWRAGPYGVALLLAIIWMARHGRPLRWLPLTGIAVPLLLICPVGDFIAPRYMVPMLPFEALALGTAAGAMWRPGRPGARLLVMLALPCLLATALWQEWVVAPPPSRPHGIFVVARAMAREGRWARSDGWRFLWAQRFSS